MALNLNARGKKIGPVVKEYSWRDVILYALGVGAGFDEFHFVHESNLKVIPTFGIATIFDFFFEISKAANIDDVGLLHGEQELICHRPIPVSGTFRAEGQITRYYDKKEKGAIVIGEADTFAGDGEKLFTAVFSLFGRYDGGFGGEDAPRKVVSFPERPPDFTVGALPSPNQPLLYRLSGDYHPLHAVPAFARRAGFEKNIIHGMCTLGFACRALIASLVPEQPEKVKRIACRFTRTLYPGEPIQTVIWKLTEGKALWKTRNAQNGDTVIDCGEFEYGVPRKG
ncbi:MAG TPA: MaoC/PaaZ C-terminal domain-containing protein [Syntrophales bacterium]|nr:MaoC/PaaZ C-terminal domain-containing protein [Syntrophales bacterium]HOX95291.1 MaoC/PaaZ C-terminal domain-containing protein [Syntrophales bacterium]HPI57996.1 MaoC/PaaZ C-terminal domain-containing protein [Syntrophales bacterium]HPN25876.1 MaoC/PaaZ C-terminal domain-containing protein [Syntrophales bacterium]HQM29568.1 MaoC/PaaZ C-terminal domain-containing protein [Syntrophales bacterium]